MAAPRRPWPTRADVVAAWMYDYIMERLRACYLERASAAPGRVAVTTEIFDAVLATRPRSPLDFDARLRALIGFLALPEAASLTAANKRIAKSCARHAGARPPASMSSPARGPAEVRLLRAVRALQDAVAAAIARAQICRGARAARAAAPGGRCLLRQVMVMDADPQLRANRLALLASCAHCSRDRRPVAVAGLSADATRASAAGRTTRCSWLGSLVFTLFLFLWTLLLRDLVRHRLRLLPFPRRFGWRASGGSAAQGAEVDLPARLPRRGPRTCRRVATSRCGSIPPAGKPSRWRRCSPARCGC